MIYKITDRTHLKVSLYELLYVIGAKTPATLKNFPINLRVSIGAFGKLGESADSRLKS